MQNNILIISGVFPPEPVVSAKLSFDIANELIKANEVVVLSPKPTRPYGYDFSQEEVKKCDFKHIVLDSYTQPKSKFFGRFRESYSFGKHCQKFICKNKDDIGTIYANTWPLFGQFLAVKAAKKYNIPIIIHVQDIYPESFANKIPLLGKLCNIFLLPIDRYVLKHSTHIIAISEKMKNYLAQTRSVSSSKITVVQNWQDEEAFIQYKQIHTASETDKFKFMYLGNIGPVAGVELLINAFIHANLSDAELIIAGSGSMKEKLKNRYLGQNNIEFWDVPDGKVPEIQAKADVMLLPIKKGAASSSIPSKLPAYMFSAKPIIACVDKNTDTADAIEQSDCGWVLPSEDVFILSTKLQEVINLPKDKLVRKGENGRNYALKNLSKKENLRKLLSIIEKTYDNTNSKN